MRKIYYALVLMLFASPASAQITNPQQPFGGPYVPITASGIFNANATTLLHWRAAIARVRAGTGRGKILIFGASQDMGAGAGSGGTGELNGAYPLSWVYNFAIILNKNVPVSYNGLFCNANTDLNGEAYSTFDTRVTLGANWSANTAGCVGGYMWGYTSGAANNFSFAPVSSFDTFIYWYFTQTGAGTSTINVDGGASLGTINYAATNFISTSQTFTVAAGTHTINVVPNNNGNFSIFGFIPYLSTTPAIDIINSSVYGATAGYYNLNTAPWTAVNMLTLLAPDLLIISMGPNDCTGSIPVSTFTANLQTVITQQKTTVVGDVLLLFAAPQNLSPWISNGCQSYISAMQSLAVSNNVAMLTIPTRWISYAVTNPVMPYGDTGHPGKLGYQDWGLAVAEILSYP